MGWNGSDGARGKAPVRVDKPVKRPSALRGVLAGGVVAAAVGIFCWFILVDRPTSEPDAKAVRRSTTKANSSKPHSKLVPTVTNAPAPKVVQQPEVATQANVPHSNDVAATEGEDLSPTNAANEKKAKPLFRNGVEQLMNMVSPSSPGVRIPPLPIINDEELAESLEKALKNVPKAEEDDTEDTIQRKLNVEDRKDELVELNNRTGATLTEYLNAVREKHNDNAEFLSEAHKVDAQIREDRSVSDEDYIKTREQIDKALEEKGLPKLAPLDGGDETKGAAEQ